MILASFVFAVAASMGTAKVTGSIHYQPSVVRQLPGYHSVIEDSCLVELHTQTRTSFVRIDPEVCRALLSGQE